MFGKLMSNALIDGLNNKITSKYKSPLPSGTGLTINQWRKDIYFFKNCLLLTHPDLFCRISRDEFNTLFYDLEKSLQDLSDDEIKLFLARIAASIGDGHTFLPLNFLWGRVIPLSFWWFGQDIRIIHSSKEFDYLRGSRLLAINGKPMFEIIKHIDRIIPGETQQYIKSQDLYPLSSLQLLSAFGFSKNDEVDYLLESCAGPPFKLSIKHSEETNYKPFSLSSLLASENNENKVNWYGYSHDGKILYFKYGRCYDYQHAVSDGLMNAEKYPDIVELCSGIIDTLCRNEVDKFILDLRGNSGGYSRLLSNFFLEEVHLLEKWKKLNKNNRIFVLIDRDTYSAAVLNCLELKTSTGSVFVGEPTGGSVNMFAGTKTFKLPNSNLYIKCASHKLFKAKGNFSSFIPDITYHQRPEGLKSNTDDVLEHVIKL